MWSSRPAVAEPMSPTAPVTNASGPLTDDPSSSPRCLPRRSAPTSRTRRSEVPSAACTTTFQVVVAAGYVTSRSTRSVGSRSRNRVMDH
jgi:hypothetical protein